MKAIGNKTTLIERMSERKDRTDREGESIKNAIELLEKTPGLEAAIRFVVEDQLGGRI